MHRTPDVLFIQNKINKEIKAKQKPDIHIIIIIIVYELKKLI